MHDTLRKQQVAWALAIRDPLQPAPAGIDPKRIALYRSLCIGSIDGVLGGSFPRLRAALGESQWQRLLMNFYADHRCTTSLFPELGGEFSDWLLTNNLPLNSPPWLAELAHFEWTRQELLFADATTSIDTAAPIALHSVVRLSPLVRACGYRWAVDQPLAIIPMPTQPTLLLIRRDRKHALQIDSLSGFDYSLLRAIDDQPLSVREHLEILASEYGEPVDTFFERGLILLAQLQASGVVQVVATPDTDKIEEVSP